MKSGVATSSGSRALARERAGVERLGTEVEGDHPGRVEQRADEAGDDRHLAALFAAGLVLAALLVGDRNSRR